MKRRRRRKPPPWDKWTHEHFLISAIWNAAFYYGVDEGILMGPKRRTAPRSSDRWCNRKRAHLLRCGYSLPHYRDTLWHVKPWTLKYRRRYHELKGEDDASPRV